MRYWLGCALSREPGVFEPSYICLLYTSGVDFTKIETDDDALLAADSLGVEIGQDSSRGAVLAEIYDKLVEPELIMPTFITDYPIEVSPLARRRKDCLLYTSRCV